MITKADMPKREATIKFRPINTDLPWRDSIDLDPVEIPVEQFVKGTPAVTDVFDSRVLALMDGLTETDPNLEYTLVWSDTGYAVKGCCPACDDVFLVADGFVGDEYDAVCCGCTGD